DERHAFVFVDASAHARDAGIAGKQGLGGEAAHGDDQLRANERDLLLEERRALRHLFGFRIAVTRRAALQYVGDVDVIAPLEADGGEHVVEELTRLADERIAEAVFFRAGRLAA